MRVFNQGWKSSQIDDKRDGSMPENLFQEERAISLHVEVIVSLGVTKEGASDQKGLPDVLFFLQLLLPMCDPGY